MITAKNNVFKLDTENTSYIFDITQKGHIRHIYYGKRLPSADVDALALKNNGTYGSSVEYDKESGGYSLDSTLLEYSGIGKGDFRHSPIELIMPDGTFVNDFVFDSYELYDGAYKGDGEIPVASGEGKSIAIRLKDKKYSSLVLTLNYTVFYKSNVIARNAVLTNKEDGNVYIRKFMSYMLDMPTSDYKMLTLDGNWAKEAHINEREISFGTIVNDSTVGASSNRHNPAFMIKAKDANESFGNVYGFNLLYSGNHYSEVEKSHDSTLRIMGGINPHCFFWCLKGGESFTAPQAIMSYSDGGTNALASNMHDFVNEHIIPEAFRYSERPVVINNWEATNFNFNRRKILALARKAKRLGVEMFVLDDGWFGDRNNDKAGLGDWVVNTKKLPGGIKALSEKINKMGLKFGLWFEPECVNEDSDLYRAHPDYAISIPGREKSYGRNQLVLDLTKKEVRDYIVDSIDRVLSSANIEYVKWDYNRHISDMYSSSLKNQGEFFHRYILGLYECLRRIFKEKHPNVLLEGCSSGGNRFDLGMLTFAPQIWTSDDTDAKERLDIQRGMYCFYPPSCISNHVSMTPNQQTLRDCALSTRFNVAVYGAFGYELDFGELTPNERKQIKEQIEFYKAHRKVFQYGKFKRCYLDEEKTRESWQISDGETTLASVYNISYCASPKRDFLRILDTEKGARYSVSSVKQYLKISRFGSLIKHVSPINVKADGIIMRTVNKHFAMVDGAEHYEASAEALSCGIPLAMQYSGTGYNTTLRILGDFGSTMYEIKKIQAEERIIQNGQTDETK